MERTRWLGRAAAVALALGASGSAQADGYLPFYGYSPYFGGPTTYFSQESDVQQVTKARDGDFGFGTRTYYRGGPFWAYRSSHAGRGHAAAPRERRARRSAALRRKG